MRLASAIQFSIIAAWAGNRLWCMRTETWHTYYTNNYIDQRVQLLRSLNERGHYEHRNHGNYCSIHFRGFLGLLRHKKIAHPQLTKCPSIWCSISLQKFLLRLFFRPIWDRIYRNIHREHYVMKLQDSSHTCTYSVALSDLDITINKIWNLKGNVQYL